ncbi:MAG TPA: hypothetical protein P5511_00385 [Candidatus Goldiibacteriota bacterium]|nr:hypothetical protein [Candidatus Goldiibacteriota bacterium]
MKYDALIFEAGTALLAAAVLAVSVVMFKLSGIIGKDRAISIPAAAASVFLVLSLAAHIYASFVILPSVESQIKMLSLDEVLFDQARLSAVKGAIAALKQQALQLRAAAFASLFIASALMAFSTGLYLRWISK